MAQPVRSRIQFTTSPERIRLLPGRIAPVALTTSSRWPLRAQGLSPRYFTVRSGEVNLLPGTTGALGMDVEPAQGSLQLSPERSTGNALTVSNDFSVRRQD